MRQNGTIAFYCEAPDDQQRVQRGDTIQGILQSDAGWYYIWKVGDVYRDCTTPEKLQRGCRVSFDAARFSFFATNISYHLVDVDSLREKTP